MVAAPLNGSAQSGVASYHMKEIPIPKLHALVSSFYVNEEGHPFLPLNGGIYLPEDSLWFLPPTKENYFTSFAPVIEDTALFVMSNTNDSSVVHYLKTSSGGSVKKIKVAAVKQGIYNLIYKNKICYIWGYEGKYSSIGIVGNGAVNWLFKMNGLIRQVQLNEASDLFFCADSSIFKLNEKKLILKLNETIDGFCFTKSNNLLVSSTAGIGIVNQQELGLIATGVTGKLQAAGNSIFLLALQRNAIFRIEQY